jgi:hypothetical protein
MRQLSYAGIIEINQGVSSPGARSPNQWITNNKIMLA